MSRQRATDSSRSRSSNAQNLESFVLALALSIQPWAIIPQILGIWRQPQTSSLALPPNSQKTTKATPQFLESFCYECNFIPRIHCFWRWLFAINCRFCGASLLITDKVNPFARALKATISHQKSCRLRLAHILGVLGKNPRIHLLESCADCFIIAAFFRHCEKIRKDFRGNPFAFFQKWILGCLWITKETSAQRRAVSLVF